MADQRFPLSLKGGSRTTWRGLADDTAVAPAGGSFRVLSGAMLSRDGTGLVPAYGTRLSGKPFYGQAFALSSIVVGTGLTTITIDASAARDDDAYLSTVFNVLFPTHPGVADDSVVLVGTRTGGNTFTVPVEFTSTTTSGYYALVQRVAAVHALTGVDGRVAAACETQVYNAAATATYRNLATVVSSGPMSLTDPPEPGVPNGTDTGMVLWPSPTMTAVNDCDYAATNSATLKKLRNYEILRRMHVAVLNGRVLIAVPGLALMFEANVRDHWQTIGTRPPTNTAWPNSRWTRMLGVPRGYMPVSAIAAAGSGSGLTSGAYYTFAVGYYNPATGEAGVPSPPQTFYHSSTQSLNVQAVYPRGAQLEAIGLQIVLYASEPLVASSSDANLLLALQAELFPYAHWGPFAQADELSLLTTDASSDATYTFVITAVPEPNAAVKPNRFPVMELPPPGASWALAAKSRLLCGGERPSYWSLNAWPIAENIPGVTAGDLRLEYFLTIPSPWNVVAGASDPGPTALSLWPTTFGGRRFTEYGTANAGRSGRMLGSVNGRRAGVGPHTFQIDCRTNNTTTYDEDHDAVYRIYSDPLVTVSEEGEPGVCPATNKLPLDALTSAEHSTGSARLGSSVLLFTLDQTQVFIWDAMPRYPGSDTLSNVHGCASPHSIVEGPGFVAWLSRRGPCMWAGQGVQFFGDRISTLWAEVAHDDEGFVACVGAAVDVDLGTVTWAVVTSSNAEWLAAADDQERSAIPADRLLIWNYRHDAFSYQERGGLRRVEALGVLPYDDGTLRITMGSPSDDYRSLYALTGAIERGETVNTFTLTADRDPSGRLATCSSVSTIGSGDYAFVRSDDGETCRWFGKIGGYNIGSFTLGETSADADGATWFSGDVLVVGGPHVVMETHRIRSSLPGNGISIDAVALHVDLSATHAYARVVYTLPDGSEATARPRWGQRLRNGVNRIVGHAAGGDVAVEITVVADGMVEIKDVVIEGSDAE